MKIDGKTLNLEKSMKILQKYKIAFAKAKLAKNMRQAIAIAKLLGYPVALKIVSSTISHKTDAGGIYLDLNDEDALKKAYDKLMKNMSKKYPKVKIDGVLVQEMVRGSQEVIIGAKKDEKFGHAIIFGLGGIFTEILNDVSFRVVPINYNDAASMIDEIKGSAILKGYRAKKYNLRSLIEILLKVSKMLENNPSIKEMDLNPVILSSNKSITVDARIILS